MSPNDVMQMPKAILRLEELHLYIFGRLFSDSEVDLVGADCLMDSF